MVAVSAFDTAFAQLVDIEKGYTDDANDPGNWTGGAVNSGELKGTNYGISAAAYPKEDIANLTKEKARSIYLQDYWTSLKCDQFPDAVGIALFKQGVNMGKSGAVKRLQEAFKIKPVDGVLGQITIGMLNTLPAKEVVEGFLTQCAVWYVSAANFDKYGKGWLSRVIGTAVEADLA